MRRAFLLLAVMSLFGCGGGAEPLQIRVRNVGDQDVDKFWLGAGGTGPRAVAFGAIAKGEASSYHGFPAVLANYRKYDAITADGARHLGVVYPERHVGTSELEPGSYTFELGVRGGTSTLRIVRD
jgi:hypothetical protein